MTHDLPHVLLVHGAATTSRCWDAVVPLLEGAGARVLAPDRASTGDLASEVAALNDLAEGTLVVGVSGGATLGLALAAGDARLAGALLHEPAVGSLLPGLLAPMAAAFAQGGVAAFGRRLYGPLWQESMAPADPGAVGRDLAMFSRFEPQRPHPGQGPVLITTGAHSPPVRHQAAAALAEHLGLTAALLPHCQHFVQLEAPALLVQAVLSRLGDAFREASAT